MSFLFFSRAAKPIRQPAARKELGTARNAFPNSFPLAAASHSPAMKKNILSLALCVLVAGSLWTAGTQAAFSATEAAARFPAPATVSPEMAETVSAPAAALWLSKAKTEEEVRKLAKDYAAWAGPAARGLAASYGVEIKEGVLGGVRVFTLTPNNAALDTADKVVYYIHGGGYILGHGVSGIGEGVLMAALGGFKVVCVDYRMAPEDPYPAAIDDAFAAYKALIEKVPADKVVVFGTSTGGAMTLILGIQAARANVAMPAALIAGTPWAEMDKIGDSYLTNEWVDNVLGSYERLIRTAATLYAGKADMKDPLLSPIHAEKEALAQFPPTLLVSGTRDLFLSNTVRMHEKLLLADRHAELIVYEALSHAQYYLNPKAPETKKHYALLGKFIRRVCPRN